LTGEILQRRWFLKIPIVGFPESLNISVSAAIIIQNLTNQLHQFKHRLALIETLKFWRSVWLGPKNSIKR
jgi:tRNA (guanosine-2'-O-)-methyltransferase